MLKQEGQTEPTLNKRKLATIDETAIFLNVPKSWLYDRTRRNEIPCVRLGKYVRFDLDEIAAWARSGCRSEG